MKYDPTTWGLFHKPLGGGFKYLLFSSLFKETIQFDEHIFQLGWNHQLDNKNPYENHY